MGHGPVFTTHCVVLLHLVFPCPLPSQLILSGDFHQLPPVAKGKDASSQVRPTLPPDAS